MDASSYFKDKKITVMGLGLLGRGVGDVRYVASCGAKLIVTDLKSKEELALSLEALADLKNVTYVLGEHRLEDFRDRDLVVYGPKTPLDSPFLKEARANGIHTTMSTALFAKIADIPVVGVTGTRGKTTTTELIAHTLKDAGRKVILGGNIRGISTLALLPSVTPRSVAVLELDSWQLQGFREEKISPHIAVFTNFMPDHLDYYKDEKEYFADKATIFQFQKSDDVLVAGKAVTNAWIEPYIIETKNISVTPRTPLQLPEDWKLQILGFHNAENASLAREALHALAIEDKQIQKSFESFEPVEGRLQFVREVDGVKIYNDNNATTPTATATALATLAGATPNLVLIAGGADKKLPLTVLSDMIRALTKAVVLLPGTGTDRLQTKLEGMDKVAVASSMNEAIEKAKMFAEKGDSIVFSPGFASFGLFVNEYDRNDQFMKSVKAL